MLAELARSNLLLVPLDRRGEWYRYHHLFRDLLLAELHRLEPGLIPVLKQRAAQWHEGNGQPGEALEYWMQADEADAVARLVSRAGVHRLPAWHGRNGRAVVQVGRRPRGRRGLTRRSPSWPP